MNEPNYWPLVLFGADLVIRLLFAARVVLRRLPIGASLAWLFVILTFPFGGALAYVLIGELRLGQAYANRAAELRQPFDAWMKELEQRGSVDWSNRSARAEALARMCQVTIGTPPTSGNRMELLSDFETVVLSLVKDIDAATESVDLEFYIWEDGGMIDLVSKALVRAAERGVRCRVLLDDVGSRAFLRSDAADRLVQGGISLQPALPARIWRLLFVRFDLRLHRKIAVIDGRIGYTGSLNMADPRYFKKSAGVGQWVDAMVRIEGPAVEILQIIFVGDWAMESGESIAELRARSNIRAQEPKGGCVAQVIPSGPNNANDAIERILLATIYSATQKLILTTPYFVPDDSLLTALISAAQRGVDVTLILPARVDSKLARLASRSIQGDLVAAGVKVLLFRGGLLHTKSVTVDGEISLFGSLNLDPRSLHLNFEITLCIFDADYTAMLENLQLHYARNSKPMSLTAWKKRSLPQKFLEDAVRLLGPLL